MIQFKKIPPGKSVLLLLLFLTTNISGFLQDYQHGHEISRKSQNRFSMDLQQPSTRNMPIRRTGIDRVINEKDGNSERLYDRRSFRTGTIQRTENVDRERSFEYLRRTTAGVRDVNNNRQRFAANLQGKFQNTRRSFDSTISRENPQRQVENAGDRRFDARNVISSNRQHNEHSLNTRAVLASRSTEIRDREVRDRRINDRRVNTESRFIDIRRNIRENAANQRREITDRQSSARRVALRELSQRQLNNRVVDERLVSRRSTRLNENRASPESIRRSLEIQRSVRSVDARDRRISEEHNVPQTRSTERLERRNSRENFLETRTAENRNQRLSENRKLDERRLSSRVRNLHQVDSSTERLQGNSRENLLEVRGVENRENRHVDQIRLSSRARNSDRLSSSTERLQRDSREPLLKTQTVENRNRRISENRNEDQRRLVSRIQNSDQVVSSTERLQRNFRESLLKTRTIENRDRRISENRNENQMRLSSETRSSPLTQRSQRNSRENYSQRRIVEDHDRRISSRQRDSQSEARLERSKNTEIRARRISDDRIAGENRLVDSRIVRDRSERDNIREGLSRHSVNKRDTNEIRVAREGRERDQTHRETSRRVREFTTESSERRDQRLSDRRYTEVDRSYEEKRTADRLQSRDSRDTRRASSQRREVDTDRVADRRRDADVRRIFRELRNINIKEQSRSDSTRYIQDNTYFRDARLTHRKISDRTTSVNRMSNENSRREYLITDRYNPLTADSRRYFEKIVSQRTRSTEGPVLNLENNIDNTYTWANTIKIMLVAFLVGQIFVNSSKANKFRFHNIISMATSIKEKVQ